MLLCCYIIDITMYYIILDICIFHNIVSSCWFPLCRARPCKHWSQLRRCACTEQQEVCQVMCLKRHLSKLTDHSKWSKVTSPSASSPPKNNGLLVRPPPPTPPRNPSWFLAFPPHEWHHLWAPVEVLHWDLATNRWTPAVWWPHARRDRCSTLSWKDARTTTLALPIASFYFVFRPKGSSSSMFVEEFWALLQTILRCWYRYETTKCLP